MACGLSSLQHDTSIRNFLTLFLSIEVTKALSERAAAMQCGDDAGRLYAERRVECLTDQLNESNPILTEISDAMTEEGVFQAEMVASLLRGDRREGAVWRERMDTAGAKKRSGNAKLMECSARFARRMKRLREAAELEISNPTLP